MFLSCSYAGTWRRPGSRLALGRVLWYPRLSCELGGDAAGTCGVGLARNDHEKAFAPSSLSCLVLPARIHSPERVRPCQARIGVCNTRHAHKARPTWPGDHEVLVDHRRLPCLISLPEIGER